MAAEFFVKLGNTFGQFIRYECPKCKQSKPISEYGGNLAEGVVCPDCGEDPIPSDLASEVQRRLQDINDKGQASEDEMVKTFLTEDFIGKVTQLSANQELVGFDAISDSIPGAEQLIGEVMAKGGGSHGTLTAENEMDTNLIHRKRSESSSGHKREAEELTTVTGVSSSKRQKTSHIQQLPGHAYSHGERGIHIIGQPQTNSSIHYGGDVTLTVTATGPQPLSYQWMKDGVVISPDVIPDCIGTDTALLHITTFLPHHEGQYHCKISSENAPSLDSDPAELKIN